MRQRRAITIATRQSGNSSRQSRKRKITTRNRQNAFTPLTVSRQASVQQVGNRIGLGEGGMHQEKSRGGDDRQGFAPHCRAGRFARLLVETDDPRMNEMVSRARILRRVLLDRVAGRVVESDRREQSGNDDCERGVEQILALVAHGRPCDPRYQSKYQTFDTVSGAPVVALRTIATTVSNKANR